MLNNLRLSFLALFVFAWFSVFSQTKHVKIIETSDVHGAIFPYNFIKERPLNASLVHVTTYIKEQRADTNQIVFLVDNGDILQGTPVVYYFNFEKTDEPHLYAEVMNFMQYDVATVGNHDVETGHPVYDKFRETINFPWLAANAIQTADDKPYFAPYHVLERGGVKIAILGLVTPSIPNWLPEKLYEGMHFEDMIETAKKWVPYIMENEQPDLMIGLFHAGVDYTYGGGSKEGYKNENASRLVAEQVPGFDIVFVGHDHSGWNFETKNINKQDVLILGTTSGARNVAVADINLESSDGGKSYSKTAVAGSLISMADYSPDAEFMAKFGQKQEEVKAYVGRTIGEFTETLYSREALFGPAKFVDLIHNIQLELTDADISFTAPLSFNATIEKGSIQVKDMFDLYSFENLLYTIELSGQEIQDYLEYSYAAWFNQMHKKSDHLLRFNTDESGKIIFSERTQSPELTARYYNYESAAGIIYTVDVRKPIGSRVKIKRFVNGKPFELEQKYKVAVNSYRANGGGGHLTRGAGIPQAELSKRILSSTEKDLRFYLMKWIEEQQLVAPKLLNNWKIKPKKYWKKGKKQDYQLLFHR